MTDRCSHFATLRDVEPSGTGCVECLALGARWVHLRVCLACGHVGCCDQSPHRHATAHFHATRHPLMKSFEPGEDWGWCYEDQRLFELMPGPSRDDRDARA